MGTYTPNHNLYKPSKGEQDWDIKVNLNWDTIDSLLGSGGGEINAGAGLTKSGDTINIGSGDGLDSLFFDKVRKQIQIDAVASDSLL